MVTDRRTDGRTDKASYRVACPQLIMEGRLVGRLRWLNNFCITAPDSLMTFSTISVCTYFTASLLSSWPPIDPSQPRTPSTFETKIVVTVSIGRFTHQKFGVYLHPSVFVLTFQFPQESRKSEKSFVVLILKEQLFVLKNHGIFKNRLKYQYINCKRASLKIGFIII